MTGIEDIFSHFEKELENETIVKEKVWTTVRELCIAEKQIHKILQVIHQTDDSATVDEKLAECQKLLGDAVRPGYGRLDTLLSPICTPPYYQFHEQWRSVTQKLSFLVALLFFLEHGKCALLEDVAAALNMDGKSGAGLALDLEDYLIGLLYLATELSRLAVNSVTLGNYHRPLAISRFIAELAAGFRLLTFKNDYLRKRYDVLKYDVKKIEEVVYDLTIRGLLTQ